MNGRISKTLLVLLKDNLCCCKKVNVFLQRGQSVEKLVSTVTVVNSIARDGLLQVGGLSCETCVRQKKCGWIYGFMKSLCNFDSKLIIFMIMEKSI